MRQLKIKDYHQRTYYEQSGCDQEDVLCEGGGSGIGQSTKTQNSSAHGDHERYNGTTKHGGPPPTTNWLADSFDNIRWPRGSRKLRNYSHLSFLADISPVVTIMQGGPRPH